MDEKYHVVFVRKEGTAKSLAFFLPPTRINGPAEVERDLEFSSPVTVWDVTRPAMVAYLGDPESPHVADARSVFSKHRDKMCEQCMLSDFSMVITRPSTDSVLRALRTTSPFIQTAGLPKPCRMWVDYGFGHKFGIQDPASASAPQTHSIVSFLGGSNEALRRALAVNESVPPASFRRISRTPQERARAPDVRRPQDTPLNQLPTHRCNSCGQVVPPGFDKTKDAKKTVDEIYDECDHVFDPDTKVCKVCHLHERTAISRFSLLEVD